MAIMIFDLHLQSTNERPARKVHAPAGVRRIIFGVSIVLLTMNLTGCTAITDTALIAPGAFDHYTCQDIEARTKTTQLRHTELEQLMARSARGPGGEFVNAIAYRTDYLQASGELKVLAKAAADKQCAIKSPFSSARSLR